MKSLLLLALISVPVYSCDDVYLKVGAGYKISQPDKFTNKESGQNFEIVFDDPLTARIEIGVERGNVSYGISHHSNWLTGFPFNDEQEIHKTEIFVDYKWSL